MRSTSSAETSAGRGLRIMCMYVWLPVHIHPHAHTYTQIHIYMYTYIYIYVYRLIDMQWNVRMHESPPSTLVSNIHFLCYAFLSPFLVIILFPDFFVSSCLCFSLFIS